MSRGNRWYVFGRKDARPGMGIEAIEPGTVYVLDGFSFTKEAAYARRDKLDRAGRAGIMVFSETRQKAMADVAEVYDGVVVEGYISPANRRAGRQLVRAMVMRVMFCPFTGVVLDMRRAVVLETPNGSRIVCTGAHWDSRRADVEAAMTQRGIALDKIKVYDGRELFKR